MSVIMKRTNQKIEIVRSKYKGKCRFTYNTNEEELKAILGVLLFLIVTKSSKESVSSIWTMDGTGKQLYIDAMS